MLHLIIRHLSRSWRVNRVKRSSSAKKRFGMMLLSRGRFTIYGTLWTIPALREEVALLVEYKYQYLWLSLRVDIFLTITTYCICAPSSAKNANHQVSPFCRRHGHFHPCCSFAWRGGTGKFSYLETTVGLCANPRNFSVPGCDYDTRSRGPICPASRSSRDRGETHADTLWKAAQGRRIHDSCPSW